MKKSCICCDQQFSYEPGRGRTPRYCSDACRSRAYRKRKKESSPIPQKMRDARRWVRCDESKRPVRPSGALSHWTQPQMWSSFSTASEARYGAGTGFVLGEGIGVIDLDNCIREDGSLTFLAENLVRANRGSFIEVSQSGRGLHIWGLLNGDVCIRDDGYEVYAGDAKRFVWVTGNVFQNGDLCSLSLS